MKDSVAHLPAFLNITLGLDYGYYSWNISILINYIENSSEVLAESNFLPSFSLCCPSDQIPGAE